MPRSMTATDFYQLTMMQGYLKKNMLEKKAVFDLFYRKPPFGGSYAVACGMDSALDFIRNLEISLEDVEALAEAGMEKDFCEWLRREKAGKKSLFEGAVWAVPEGSLVLPNEPVLRIEAPLYLAQVLETPLLNIVNYETLIATKASRIVNSAKGRPIMEFGMRRARGIESSVRATRAAYVGGVSSTSNVLAWQDYRIPVSGTMSHAWVMAFPSELDAFRAYMEQAADNVVLLIDTYDTLESGLPNAIRVFAEMFGSGKFPKMFGIRIDSGDLADLSRKARQALDENGFGKAKIIVSNDLDEYIIESLLAQGAAVDIFGVGTKLVNAEGSTSLGGVYKLAEIDGMPRMKITGNPEKMTNPGKKQVWRVWGREGGASGKDDGPLSFVADILALEKEEYSPARALHLDDPARPWTALTLEAGSYVLKPMLSRRDLSGKTPAEEADPREARKNLQLEMERVRPQCKRLVNPETMRVDLSRKLARLKTELIEHFRPEKG